MRTIKTSAGTPIDLDGDVLAVLEAVSRDLLRRQELEYGFEDVDREFAHLVDPDDGERAARLPQGKPVHELQPVRKRPARRIDSAGGDGAGKEEREPGKS